MKSLVRIIRETFASKQSEQVPSGDHPNFWMYQ